MRCEEFYLQQVLQRVVVLVEPRVPDGHDEVEEGLQPRLLAGTALLNPEDGAVITLCFNNFTLLETLLGSWLLQLKGRCH